MENVNKLINLLGEDNEKRLRDNVTDLIIDAMRDDLESYNRENYILDADDVIDFIAQCQKEAFEKIKPRIINDFMEKIEKKVYGEQ